MSKLRRSLLKMVVLGALFATALGGAYMGFQSGGQHEMQPDAARRDAGRAAARRHAASDPKVEKGDASSKDGEADEEKDSAEEAEFHRRLKKFFNEGDEHALDGLRPKGVTKIEGEGGKGLGRQVKSGGKWYPVFDLSHGTVLRADGSVDQSIKDPRQVQLTRIPLAIASPNPPQGVVGQPYTYSLIAIGGTPPYQWTMQTGGGGEGFTLDAGSGTLSGLSQKPVTAVLNVFVGDAAGDQASTVFSLVIAPATPLAITTTTLPVAIVGKEYHAVLRGEGGVEPHTWTLATTSGPWQCDPMTGEITGTPTQAEELSLQVTLTDQQRNTVQKAFDLKASNGLNVTTESPLLPAAPGSQYTLTFEAEGGTTPYTWKVVSGALPANWNLSDDGMLSGLADNQESRYQFTVEVTDNDGLTFRKPFELVVIEALSVVPSRQRAGLAWQPLSLGQAAGSPVQTVDIVRSGAGADVEVYNGGAVNNMVDHNLVTGATYDYKLTVHTVEGRSVPFGTKRIKVLPMTLQRAVPGVTGDPYADRVVAFNPLSASAYGAAGLPFNVTGPPDGRSTFSPAYLPTEVASLNARLGAGGSITLQFTDNIVELGPGPDFTVFENVLFQNGDPGKRFMEPAVIDVALFDGQWFRFPINVNPPVSGSADLTRPTYYAQGFAGVNGTTGDDPTNPSRSGGDSFDADALGVPGLSWIRFIRITSTGDKAMRDLNGVLVQHTSQNGALSGGGSSGFDLDAVSAVNY